MTQVYQEYRNQHAHRNYPFADDATLVATNGVALPSDFMLDAMLYPIDLVNGLYMKSVDFGARTLVLADTVTDTVHGTATWSDSEDTAYVYEDSDIARMVGVIVFGEGRLNQSTGGVLEFTPVTAVFTPTAYYPLNQPGVRGVLLENNSFYTGDLELIGRNGVTIDSYVDSEGRSVIRIDIEGLPEEVEPCFDCGLVRCIKIVTSSGSLLVPSHCQPNVACITTSNFDLQDVCPPSNIKLPSVAKDPCDSPGSGPTSVRGASANEFTICPEQGRVHILAPSTDGYDNPLCTVATEEPAPPPNYRTAVDPQGLSLDERTRMLERMFDTTALSRGKLKIEYRGLTTGRHY